MAILVFTENWDGKFKKLSFELISYAAALAKELGTTVTALSIGRVANEELLKLGIYGASKVLTLENEKLISLINTAYSTAIFQAAVKENSEIVILSNNFTGKALAPRVSVKLNAGLVGGVIALPAAVNPFVVRKKVYNGKGLC